MMKYLLILFTVILAACQGSTDIKEIRDFKNQEWPIAKKIVFKFKIDDASKNYKINYLIRNSISYPYYNLYLNQALKDTAGNVLAASMDEIILFEKQTGKPLGNGLGDIFDLKMTAPKLASVKFPKPGRYQWIITHNMRPDPLEGIMSMGLEVIKEK